MAYAKKSRTTRSTLPQPMEDTPPIVITQVVSVVYPTLEGEHGMLATAYLAAGQFIQENAAGENIHLTWEYGGGVFTATYEAARPTSPSYEEDPE
jgi:hypothetical protein